MTVETPPTIVPRSGRPPEDDLDVMLRAYFQAEMPNPWPSFEAPAPRNGVLPLRRPQAPRFTLWRSRLALAAAILLLIAGTIFLFGRSGNQDASPIITPTADRSPLIIPVDPQQGASSIRQDVPIDDVFPMK